MSNYISFFVAAFTYPCPQSNVGRLCYQVNTNVDNELENAISSRKPNTDEVHYSDGLIQDGVHSIASTLE